MRWQYRLRLPATGATDGAVSAVEKQAQTQFPDAGWEIRTRKKASPQLERNVERFSQFLTLVALTALLVGGVGVANAVASHLARKRDVIAHPEGTRRDRRRRLRRLLRGDHAGRAVRHPDRRRRSARRCRSRSRGLFGAAIPLPVAPALHPAVLTLSIVYGLLTALAFALWPLGRARDISVSMLFRDQIAAERHWPRRRYIVATALIVAALAALAIFFAYDRRLAAIFVGSAAVIFVALRLIAR